MIDFWIFPLSTIWGAYQIGGLNNFINNLCIKYRLNIDIINIYVRDGFGQSGNLDDLRKKAKIDYSTIINIVKKLENKKSDK